MKEKKLVEKTNAMTELNLILNDWTQKFFGEDKGLFVEMTLTAIALNSKADFVDSTLSFSKHMTSEQIEKHSKALLDYSKQIEKEMDEEK